MPTFRTIVTAAMIGLAGAGCGHRTTTEPAGAYRVRVFNDSPFVLSNVRVVTGEGASILRPPLAPM